jgi:hypothetical protein
MEAFIAFRMLSFPVPPLPLLANRGEEGTDAIASSHDLMARAMQLQYLTPHPHMSMEQSQQVMKEKEDICNRMIQGVVDIWSKRADLHMTDEQAVERCYIVFQRTFREYMAHYPGSPDLRFAPICDVHRGINVHAQAVAFLRRLALSVEDSGLVSELDSADYDRQTYLQVLQRYVKELFEMCEEHGAVE